MKGTVLADPQDLPGAFEVIPWGPEDAAFREKVRAFIAQIDPNFAGSDAFGVGVLVRAMAGGTDGQRRPVSRGFLVEISRF